MTLIPRLLTPTNTMVLHIPHNNIKTQTHTHSGTKWHNPLPVQTTWSEPGCSTHTHHAKWVNKAGAFLWRCLCMDCQHDLETHCHFQQNTHTHTPRPWPHASTHTHKYTPNKFSTAFSQHKAHHIDLLKKKKKPCFSLHLLAVERQSKLWLHISLTETFNMLQLQGKFMQKDRLHQSLHIQC